MGDPGALKLCGRGSDALPNGRATAPVVRLPPATCSLPPAACLLASPARLSRKDLRIDALRIA